MFYSLDKLKPKTKNQILLLLTFWLCYILWIGRTRKPFSPFHLFSFPPYSKCINNSSNFHLHQQKIFWSLVFRFQFIQWIQHIFRSFDFWLFICFTYSLINGQIKLSKSKIWENRNRSTGYANSSLNPDFLVRSIQKILVAHKWPTYIHIWKKKLVFYLTPRQKDHLSLN